MDATAVAAGAGLHAPAHLDRTSGTASAASAVTDDGSGDGGGEDYGGDGGGDGSGDYLLLGTPRAIKDGEGGGPGGANGDGIGPEDADAAAAAGPAAGLAAGRHLPLLGCTVTVTTEAAGTALPRRPSAAESHHGSGAGLPPSPAAGAFQVQRRLAHRRGGPGPGGGDSDAPGKVGTPPPPGRGGGSPLQVPLSSLRLKAEGLQAEAVVLGLYSWFPRDMEDLLGALRAAVARARGSPARGGSPAHGGTGGTEGDGTGGGAQSAAGIGSGPRKAILRWATAAASSPAPSPPPPPPPPQKNQHHHPLEPQQQPTQARAEAAAAYAAALSTPAAAPFKFNTPAEGGVPPLALDRPPTVAEGGQEAWTVTSAAPHAFRLESEGSILTLTDGVMDTHNQP
jgi:hypothetical protein